LEGDYPNDEAVTVDPTGPAAPGRPPDENVRMVRGGAWTANPKSCRSGYRWGLSASRKGHDVGFRVALDP
jgi:formylglycine-generating enzyme required for sulfatase activity